MSHVATVSLEVHNLDALKTVAESLGAEFRENQRTHHAYTGGQPCLHAIHVPGVRYEIGVVAGQNGAFDLALDDYGYGHGHDGNRLVAHFGGRGLPKLRQGYAVEVTKRELARKGYRVVTSVEQDGSVRVRASR